MPQNNVYQQYYNQQQQAQQPNPYATQGPVQETRSGPGHFGAATPAATGPSSEARSGAGHFGAAPAMGPSAIAQSPYGTESGPGILESWFNQRANGTDPAFQYAMQRGSTALDNQYSAAGAYNSGAAAQGHSDLYSNLISQRQGQLDQLAAGASGEHQNRLNSMFGQGAGLAGGEAGTMGAYDLASANSNNALMNALVQMMGNKAGVDAKANQGLLNNVLGIASVL